MPYYSQVADGLNISGTTVSITAASAPVAGQVLTATSATVANWQLPFPTGSMPTDQARRTTTYTLTGSFADITFDTTDVENDTTTLQHNVTNTERIDIKVAGQYLITFSAQSPSLGTTQLKVVKNNATDVPGSLISNTTVATALITMGNAVVATFAVNDYITLQATGTAGTLAVGTLLNITRLTATAFTDATAIHVGVSGEIAGISEKTTPTGNDLLVIEDSAASNAKKRLKISNLPTATPAATIVTDTANTTTTSAVDVLVASMTITPASGTYLVCFSGDIHHNVGDLMTMSIYSGGSLASGSQVGINSSNGTNRFGFCCQAKVTVNGAQAIEGRWKTNSATANSQFRALSIIAVT